MSVMVFFFLSTSGLVPKMSFFYHVKISGWEVNMLNKVSSGNIVKKNISRNSNLL